MQVQPKVFFSIEVEEYYSSVGRWDAFSTSQPCRKRQRSIFFRVAISSVGPKLRAPGHFPSFSRWLDGP